MNPIGPSSARRLAWIVGSATIAMMLGAIALVYLDRNADSPFHQEYWNVADVADMVTNIGVPVIGIVLASRRPGNLIGWLFLVAGLALGISALFDMAANHILSSDPTSTVGLLATWVARWIWPIPVCSLPFLFLLFPDGHLHSRRWLPVAWLAGIAAALLVTGSLVTATLQWSHPLGEDFGPGAVGAVSQALFLAGFVALPISLIASFIGLTARFRASRGEERLQLKWFVTAAATVAVSFAVATLPFEIQAVPQLTTTVTLLFLYVAIAVSVLKYRLYDIDVVIGRAVVFAVLAAFITAVYIALVIGIGTLVGTARSPFLSAAAAAVVALAFQPVRQWARRLANRVVYGDRATPYEVLSGFTERAAETYSTEDVLPRMVRVLAEGIGADQARVWLSVGNELRPAAAWPPDGAVPPIALGADGGSHDLPLFPDRERAFPVVQGGELLGAISVVTPATEPLGSDRERLVTDVAAQTGLVLRNVRLIEELRESRRRIVAAQDERAKALERNLHDGAQQQLVALAVKQRLTESLVERDPDRAKSMLAEVQSDLQDALENLRDLARGIYPPLLADRGLPAALEAQARKAALPVAVDAREVGRHPQGVEAAVYFSCLEALQNVAKYAEASRADITLTVEDGALRFRVADDGIGFDVATAAHGSGLQGMADRLDAIGGSLEIRSAPGAGTTIAGSIPVGR